MTDIFNTFYGKAYRFIPIQYFIQAIEKASLRFSRIDTFNDPLDSSPYLSFEKWWEKYQGDFKTIHDLKNRCFKRFTENYYAYCLCKEYDTPDSYLMWAHYGQSHTQMCFEIDFGKYKIVGGPSNITYENDIAKVRDSLINSHPNVRGLFLATTKLNQWKYEKEVRLIIDTKISKNSPFITLEQDHRHLNFQFNPSVISKVIFGINANPKEEFKVIALMKSIGLNPIFEKMVIDPVILQLKSIKYYQFMNKKS